MIAPSGRGGPQIIPRPEHARPGGPPPWNHMPPSARRIDLDDLESRLAEYEPRFIDRGFDEPDQASAVLVPLYLDAGEPMVLLTRRSLSMRSHTHEVAFPGGRQDDGDPDLVATALREAQEEVALEPNSVRIIGQLDRFVTVGSRSLVHPYVGRLQGPPEDLIANPDEVEAILYVPLAELLLDEVWREERWNGPGRPVWPVTFFELHGDTVWGATGNMLRQLLTIATDPL